MPGLPATTRAGMLTQQLYFTYATRRGWHPMMGGIWQHRTDAARRTAVSDAEAAARFLGDDLALEDAATAAPLPMTARR